VNLQFNGSQLGVGTAPQGSFSLYVTGSANDSLVGFDSSANINSLILLDRGVEKFELSFDKSATYPILRLMPHTTASMFQIGNPSNASGANTDYIMVSEPFYGNVMIGPGLANGIGNIPGATAATHKVQIKGNMYVSGSISALGDVVAFFSSDERLKTNINIIPNALDKVLKLDGVTWEWNKETTDETYLEKPKTGLIAQQVQKVLPEVVTERNDGYLALDYSKMMGLLVQAIKEQQDQINELKKLIQNGTNS
jgi:signal peptidase I